MQPDKSVLHSSRCFRPQLLKAVYSCSFPCKGGSKGGSSKRLFCCLSDPQSGLANAPMSGRHSYTDASSLATPLAVAFLSDHENEQHKPTPAFSPRYGRSIERIRRSAYSSPSKGWLKILSRSGVLGSPYACDLE